MIEDVRHFAILLGRLIDCPFGIL